VNTAVKQVETVTRHVGNCQLCEGDFKLTDDKRMVHHGYKRPGDGEIHGDCPAVGLPPYEISCEAIKAYVIRLRGSLQAVKARLAQIAAGEVTEFEKRGHKGYKHNMVWFTVSYSRFVTERFHFDTELHNMESHLKYEVSNLERDIKHREARIAAWVKKPTRTVEECTAAERSVKDAARAVRAAAKAERDAKKAATKAKMDALEARRKAVRDSYIERLTALAAQAPSEARNIEADKLFEEMTSKKGRKASDLHYLGQLHVPHLFVTVGLGTYRGDEKNVNGWGDRFVDFHFTNRIPGNY
jgi:hypothetical protein